MSSDTQQQSRDNKALSTHERMRIAQQNAVPFLPDSKLFYPSNYNAANPENQWRASTRVPGAFPKPIHSNVISNTKSNSISDQESFADSQGTFERAIEGDAQNSPSLYKTELCRSFAESGFCRYGNKCRFAHGDVDLRPVNRHKKYKTEKCINYSKNGVCPYGPRCRFIHDDEDKSNQPDIISGDDNLILNGNNVNNDNNNASNLASNQSHTSSPGNTFNSLNLSFNLALGLNNTSTLNDNNNSPFVQSTDINSGANNDITDMSQSNLLHNAYNLNSPLILGYSNNNNNNTNNELLNNNLYNDTNKSDTSPLLSSPFGIGLENNANGYLLADNNNNYLNDNNEPIIDNGFYRNSHHNDYHDSNYDDMYQSSQHHNIHPSVHHPSQSAYNGDENNNRYSNFYNNSPYYYPTQHQQHLPPHHNHPPHHHPHPVASSQHMNNNFTEMARSFEQLSFDNNNNNNNINKWAQPNNGQYPIYSNNDKYVEVDVESELKQTNTVE